MLSERCYQFFINIGCVLARVLWHRILSCAQTRPNSGTAVLSALPSRCSVHPPHPQVPFIPTLLNPHPRALAGVCRLPSVAAGAPARPKPQRTAAHNEAIAAGVRRKWMDPEYRSKVVGRMHDPAYQSQRVVSWKARTRPLPPHRSGSLSSGSAVRPPGSCAVLAVRSSRPGAPRAVAPAGLNWDPATRCADGSECLHRCRHHLLPGRVHGGRR